MQLVRPSLEYLPSYEAALQRGWSPDNLRGAEVAREQLDAIATDPAGFVASLEDIEAKGGPVKLPDGSLRPRLPGYRRWMWDGEFCGSIGFRWSPGTSALPDHVPGHIGYAVVPWKRGRGYARHALMLLLPDAKARGLDYLELTTEPDNVASQRVIVACGGELVGRFRKHEVLGGHEGLRYRLTLTEASAS
jgi:predicted acetyltransferase